MNAVLWRRAAFIGRPREQWPIKCTVYVLRPDYYRDREVWFRRDGTIDVVRADTDWDVVDGWERI